MPQFVVVRFGFWDSYGPTSSLIQAESIDGRRIMQAFGLLILFFGVLALAQFIAAPLAATYFRQPIIADMLRLQRLLYI
jgi:hypothetical protein